MEPWIVSTGLIFAYLLFTIVLGYVANRRMSSDLEDFLLYGRKAGFVVLYLTVVATYHSGIPEGVVSGKTAELVSPGDHRALAENLQSFLTSPEKVESFGLAGRKFVSENFELRNQVRGLERIYSELIATHAGHGAAVLD